MSTPDFTKIDYRSSSAKPVDYATWKAKIEAETGKRVEDLVWKTMGSSKSNPSTLTTTRKT